MFQYMDIEEIGEIELKCVINHQFINAATRIIVTECLFEHIQRLHG